MTPMTLQEQLYQELCKAAKAGDLVMVKTLIAGRAPLKIPPRSMTNAITPLEHAIDAGNQDLIKLLIQKGADLGFSRQGRTPLGRATQVVLTAHWNDQDETAGIEVFTLLAEAGSPWKPQSTLDAPDEPYLFERWMEQISPSQREVVDKLQPIVDRANAQLRKNQLETLLEPAAIEPEVARSPRAPRF